MSERLFVDMDGTLAQFKVVDQLETLYEEGYFLNLSPNVNVVEGLKNFMENHPDVEVFVLSSVLSDSEYALSEKEEWLNKYIPEIDSSHRIFSPCGASKAEYVPGGLKGSDLLLDDYSENLHAWQPPGVGIKLMNGINGTKGTWKGSRISYDLSPELFSESLYLKIVDRQIVKDDLSKRFKEYQDNKEDLNYAAEAIIELEEAEMGASEARQEDRLSPRSAGEGLCIGEGREVRTRGRLAGRYLTDGQISLIGEKVGSADELARLLQCYRNPLFETARGFYLKDGYIVASEAVSSRLPGIAVFKTADGKPFSDHVNEKMAALNADTFYAVHNHPSANPKPSMEDRLSTRIDGEMIKGYAGHIVLDHTKYALINTDGEFEFGSIPDIKGSDHLLSVDVSHPLLGECLRETDDIAKAGKFLLDDNAENFSFTIYLSGDKHVREVQEISNAVISDSMEFREYMRNELLNSGSDNAVLFTTSESIYENLKPLITERFLNDVFFIDKDYDMYWSQKEAGVYTDKDYIFAGTKFEDVEYFRHEEAIISEDVRKVLSELTDKKRDSMALSYGDTAEKILAGDPETLKRLSDETEKQITAHGYDTEFAFWEAIREVTDRADYQDKERPEPEKSDFELE